MRALTEEPYTVDIDVFEGPLDLLLYLLRREELDIYDIPIEHITSQYVQYLDMMRMLDLNIAGEFLVMAATLMVIKSRMLLPVEVRPEDDVETEAEDPRWELVRQLVEYKKFKDAAARLMEREELQSETFGQGGGTGFDIKLVPDDPDLALGDIGLFDLLTAFQAVLDRAPDEPFGHLEPLRWSVPDKMEAILVLARREQTLSFASLFHVRSTRGEVIVTFLALLELLRLRQVAARQTEVFGAILIEATLPDETSSDRALSADVEPFQGGLLHV